MELQQIYTLFNIPFSDFREGTLRFVLVYFGMTAMFAPGLGYVGSNRHTESHCDTFSTRIHALLAQGGYRPMRSQQDIVHAEGSKSQDPLAVFPRYLGSSIDVSCVDLLLLCVADLFQPIS